MKALKIAALKDNLSATLREVEAGTEILVTDRDRPIAILRPVEDEDGVCIAPPGRPFSSVRQKTFAPTKRPIDSLATLRAERGER